MIKKQVTYKMQAFLIVVYEDKKVLFGKIYKGRYRDGQFDEQVLNSMAKNLVYSTGKAIQERHADQTTIINSSKKPIYRERSLKEQISDVIDECVLKITEKVNLEDSFEEFQKELDAMPEAIEEWYADKN